MSNVQSGSLPLPIDLTPLGLTGCQLFAEALLLDALLATGTTATWSIALPAGTNLLGIQFFYQGAVIDVAAKVGGFVLSNAGAAMTGSWIARGVIVERHGPWAELQAAPAQSHRTRLRFGVYTRLPFLRSDRSRRQAR
ncbi:MAG: hypothetical protein ABIP94_22150 [Planctomycetota bacterium]